MKDPTPFSPSQSSSAPPQPAELIHLRPTNRAGTIAISSCVLFTALGLTLSVLGGVFWLPGQIMFAFALVQWLAVLHGCGHETLFRTRWPHVVIGHVAAFFAVIPFRSWKRVPPRLDPGRANISELLLEVLGPVVLCPLPDK